MVHGNPPLTHTDLRDPPNPLTPPVNPHKHTHHWLCVIRCVLCIITSHDLPGTVQIPSNQCEHGMWGGGGGGGGYSSLSNRNSYVLIYKLVSICILCNCPSTCIRQRGHDNNIDCSATCNIYINCVTHIIIRIVLLTYFTFSPGGAVTTQITSITSPATWSVTTGGYVYDMTYDTRHGTVWAVIGDGSTRRLCEYNMKGECVREVGKGMVGSRVCVDTRRDCLVVSVYDRLLCIDREGGKVREIRVPGARDLYGVVYCEERDVYVVGDVGVHCLWYIDAGSGAVVRQVGSEGSEEGQFKSPLYLYHHHVSEGECHIYVSDRDNHCISLYTASGDYIRRFGSQGSGDRQLFYPYGVCVDGSGRVVVCDRGNKRVVRYWWERDVEQWDVILTPQQLGGGSPWCVLITPDSHIVVGTYHSKKLLCYRYILIIIIIGILYRLIYTHNTCIG